MTNNHTENVSPRNSERIEDKLPFSMQVTENPSIDLEKIKIGQSAMKAAGAQPEFVAANMFQARSLKCAVILRAGEPPQYNKPRSPKSGLNLTKTSKQGFFKGSLAKELRFSRFDSEGKPMPHHQKDEKNLNLPVDNLDYQHTMQLDINMQDILRETNSDGDLTVLAYDESRGLLLLAYKKGKGPSRDDFDGQFVIDLTCGDPTPQFYSRPWDKPNNQPNWNEKEGIIEKPKTLSVIPDEVYRKVFNHTFKVSYTEKKSLTFSNKELKKAQVFANRPRYAEDFLNAMDFDNPDSKVLKLLHGFLGKDNTAKLEEELATAKSLGDVIKILSTTLGVADAQIIIKATYDEGGRIVAGDWDGMALGHPKDLAHDFRQVYNTFLPGLEGLKQINELHMATSCYFEQIKSKALEKRDAQETLSFFEEKILSIDVVDDVISPFSIERAGCITPHEFLFQQVLNDSYRDEACRHYGEQYDMSILQKTMNQILLVPKCTKPKEQRKLIKNLLVANFAQVDACVPEFILKQMKQHLFKHYQIAIKENRPSYEVPHLGFDLNLNDLYQHGFDMRNPYGSNLDGEWLMIHPDGGIIYGETQEELIEVLLMDNFLDVNLIEVNHGADMSAGWDRLIERQLSLGQFIPEKTLKSYQRHLKAQIQNQEPISFETGILVEKKDEINKFIDMKKRFSIVRDEAFCSNQQLDKYVTCSA